mmetsp:Transcript_72083/g.220671  ORF Transcript_72083/g.220671 Transcript_72083/m.220671 type:complete len:648 (+) Transcript_72083:492-2435(+)
MLFLDAAAVVDLQDDMGLGRVNEEQLALMRKGDPILLGLPAPAVRQAVRGHRLGRRVHRHIGGEVHLSHRVGRAPVVYPAAALAGVWRQGRERNMDVPINQHKLRVLGAVHDVTDQCVVLRDPRLLHAQVRPSTPDRRAETGPLADVRRERLHARRGPRGPGVAVEASGAQEDARMPDVLLDRRRHAPVRPRVAARLGAVAAGRHDHLAAEHSHGRVDQGVLVVSGCAVSTRTKQAEPHVDAMCIEAHDGWGQRGERLVGAGLRQEAATGEGGRDRERHNQPEPRVRRPPALDWLLDARGDHHRQGDEEDQEKREVDVARLRPEAVRNELEDVNRVGIPLQEIELREGLGEHRQGQAWQAGQTKEHHGLEGKQHRQPRRQLVAPHGWLHALDAEHQYQSDVPRWRDELDGDAPWIPPGIQSPSRLRLRVEEPTQLGEHHAQHEHVNVTSRVEFQRDHAVVQHQVGSDRPRRVPILWLPRNQRHEDHEPGQKHQEHHQCARADERQALQAPRERFEQKPIDDHAAEKPAVHLQGAFGPTWPPRLHQEGLNDQSHDPGVLMALCFLDCELDQQSKRVERIDGHAPLHHIPEHALLLRPSQMRGEQHEPRQHEKPRHPREAPTEKVLRGDDVALGEKVADHDVQTREKAR